MESDLLLTDLKKLKETTEELETKTGWQLYYVRRGIDELIEKYGGEANEQYRNRTEIAKSS